MLKNTLVILCLFSLSTEVFSETYVCSHELTKFGQPGEIETVIFERNGGSFNYEYMGIAQVDAFQISVETKPIIILTDLNSYPQESIDVVFLNKQTKEWGRKFLTFEDTKEPGLPNHGKCVILN